MIITASLGNSQIRLGIIDGDDIVLRENISTRPFRTEIEYALLLQDVLKIRGIDPADIDGAVISSVVPQLTHVFREGMKLAAGVPPLVAGPGVKNGLKIGLDDPKSMGVDLAVNAVGALCVYEPPLILIDMGASTTISCLNGDGVFIGGMILPGMLRSLDALVSGAQTLPQINMDPPERLIGTNTVDCMKSGVIYGQAAMLDALTERLREDMKAQARAIACGESARLVLPHCRTRITYDNDLAVRGMKRIWEMNRPKGKKK